MANTDRFALPLLAAGQSQKEVTHNESLALVDLLVQPIVQSVAPQAVPASPVLGACWIVGPGAVGSWAGQDRAIACWTSGGWRFVPAQDGMAVWSLADAMMARFASGAWVLGAENVNHLNVNNTQVVGARQSAIPSPNGGINVDVEARGAIIAVLGALRNHGLIAN